MQMNSYLPKKFNIEFNWFGDKHNGDIQNRGHNERTQKFDIIILHGYYFSDSLLILVILETV